VVILLAAGAGRRFQAARPPGFWAKEAAPNRPEGQEGVGPERRYPSLERLVAALYAQPRCSLADSLGENSLWEDCLGSSMGYLGGFGGEEPLGALGYKDKLLMPWPLDLAHSHDAKNEAKRLSPPIGPILAQTLYNASALMIPHGHCLSFDDSSSGLVTGLLLVSTRARSQALRNVFGLSGEGGPAFLPKVSSSRAEVSCSGNKQIGSKETGHKEEEESRLHAPANIIPPLPQIWQECLCERPTASRRHSLRLAGAWLENHAPSAQGALLLLADMPCLDPSWLRGFVAHAAARDEVCYASTAPQEALSCPLMTGWKGPPLYIPRRYWQAWQDTPTPPHHWHKAIAMTAPPAFMRDIDDWSSYEAALTWQWQRFFPPS
jgi:MobA-like NTP transferase domain